MGVLKLDSKPLRILDFDIENRPLSYWYDGNCTAEITAIAWSWVGEDEVHCEVLTRHAYTMRLMLNSFCAAYLDADIVTGHYIRKHDLPIINAHMIEHGFAPLPEKLASDTKMDLTKFGDQSASQESLAELLGVDVSKYHMTQKMWRDANRLTPDGIELTRKRVIDDVIQHKALRLALIEAGALGTPRVWSP